LTKNKQTISGVDKHYFPGFYEDILLRCKVGCNKEDIEIQKASEERSGSVMLSSG
jgi:hypothetical protein